MKTGFIFSLPRAGSTYVQRVLSAAEGVRTTSEPWLLPPLLGIRHGEQPYADFAYDHVRRGIEGMLQDLPDADAAWRRSVRVMVESLYREFCSSGEIFIDKTPRNAVFSSEIMRTFDEAPVLFLWRNPLAVAHSINETWGDGRWKTYFYEYDLYAGQEALIAAYSEFRDEPRVMAVRYEDLVSEPKKHWPSIFSHFGLEYRYEYVAEPPKLLLAMGDQRGQEKYSGTSTGSVHSWTEGFDTSIRRIWARRYLKYMGAERLALMGYSLNALLNQLGSAPSRFRISDVSRVLFSSLYHRVDPFIWRENWRGLRAKRYTRR